MEVGQVVNYFKNLKTDKAHGVAPHKPILLLSVLQAIDANLITENKIYITPELVAFFKSNWSALVTSSHECKFSLPFYHLKGDNFWILHPNLGFENILQLKGVIRSFNQLKSAVSYASFTSSIFDTIKDKRNSDILKEYLVETYFPNYKNSFSISNNTYYTSIENKIINESASQYTNEIIYLKEVLSQDSFQEEIFLRSGIFKR